MTFDFNEIAAEWEVPVHRAEKPSTIGDRVRGFFAIIRMGCAVLFWVWVVVTAILIVLANAG